MKRFSIRFDAGYSVLSTALFISPSDSFLEIDDHEIAVRMAWAFRARFPRSAVASTALVDTHPISRGVHGLSGRWLVNGSGDGLLTITLNPIQTARVLGISVRLRELTVSVDDPGALSAALR